MHPDKSQSYSINTGLYSTQAEHCVLGAILCKPDLLSTIYPPLTPEDFHHDDHREIWQAILLLRSQDAIVDPLSVADYLQNKTRREMYWLPLCSQLVQTLPSTANTARYAEIVKEKATARRVQQELEIALEKAKSGDLNGILDSLTQLISDSQPKISEISHVSSNDLQAQHFEPVRWIIPDLIPEGLGVIGGDPKIGKSFLCMNAAIAASMAGMALGGFDVTEKAEVVYMALEDNPRRLKTRMQQLIADDAVPWPTNLRFITMTEYLEAKAGGATLAQLLAQYLEAHPDTRMIIIDPLEKARFDEIGKSGGKNAYQSDYSFMSSIQQLALDRHISILFVHHLRKPMYRNGEAEDDPLSRLSGSMGIPGSMDLIMLLTRTRNKSRGELFVTGRDIMEEKTYIVEKSAVGWAIVGDKESPQGSAIELAVLEFLDGAEDGLTARDIADGIDENYNSVRRILASLLKNGKVDREMKRYYASLHVSGHQPKTPKNG